jgi:dihydrofolate reductase
MRKSVAGLFISLDAVVESPERWHFPYFNDEMGETVSAQMAESDCMLLGRVTYEQFAAYWPNQTSDGEAGEMVGFMNETPKYVISSTLNHPEWKNTTLIDGTNVADALTRLNQQPGKDISITGSGTLVRALLRDGRPRRAPTPGPPDRGRARQAVVRRPRPGSERWL